MEDKLQPSFRIEPYNKGTFVLNELGEELFKRGEQALKKGTFGVVLLAGGQGSRLGSDQLKALFKLCGRPLIDYHIERIVKLIKKYNCLVKIFVMVSSFTEKDIRNYLDTKDFGVPLKVVVQEDRICTDFEGNVLKNDQGGIIKAPGGNGDVFRSLKNEKLTEFVCVNIISIDNVLATVFDPLFVGAFLANNCEILSKAVKKRSNESVGVFVCLDNHLKVIEYIDLPKDQLSEDGNICNHLFSGDFIMKMANKNLPEHSVTKKIPFFKDGKWIKPNKPNGLKKETFIFDCFGFSNRNFILRVCRENEFSPLKNGLDCEIDNPRTCEEALKKLNN